LVVDFDTTVNSSPTDISGRGNHGTMVGATYSAADKAFNFDGTDDYIQTGLSINAVGTPQHTFSLWVKPSAGDMDDTDNHYICIWGNTTAQNSWSGLALKSGGLAHVYHSSGKYTSDVLFTTNNWHHIVVVIKSTTATTAIGRDVDFYVDGVLYSGSYSTLGSNAGNSAYYLDWGSGTSTRVRLGSLLSGDEDSSSSISNFKLYNVALEASEVQKLYRLGRTGRSMVISDTAVGIGKVPEAQLDVRGVANFGSRVGIGKTGAGYPLDVVGEIYASGDIIAFSDERKKTDIEPIPNALEKVLQLRGVTFNKLDDDNRRHAGVIAQEVEKVLPEVVYTSEDGTKSVAYGNLVGLLIEAIKELAGK